MDKYYSPKPILKMKDLEGLDPSLFIVTSNRSAGKTTSLLFLGYENFEENKRKFALIFRYQYELDSASTILQQAYKLYQQVENNIIVSDNELEEKFKTVIHAKGLFYEILFDGESYAFALSLSNVDSVKKYSPLFAEIDLVIMDEYQKEDGKYLKNEVEKLQSLLITIARGGGEQSRNIKVFLLGNNISMLNPYSVYFGFPSRVKKDTKFLRGKGWVAEFNFNESASNALKQNGLFRAFDNSEYMKTSADNVTLWNEDEFIGKPTGKTRYLFTIKHNGVFWGVRESINSCKVYIDDKYDPSCRSILVFENGEHSANTVRLERNSFTYKKLKESYNMGLLMCSNLNAKKVIIDILSLEFR